ncbi:phage tail assembly protein [Lysobacter sp. TAF61]|uniref:phage tail assembly protein n=1 Tax=Lysobacter sp. TAF61 TaxID=3233072 RepID=UPI003F9C85FF
MSKTTPAPAATVNPAPPPIILETPLQRGDQKITEIQLRKPQAGELRGVSLVDLLQMEVTALQTVLPRITAPALTAHDVGQLDPADLLQLAGGISAFLLPRAVREMGSPAA